MSSVSWKDRGVPSVQPTPEELKDIADHLWGEAQAEFGEPDENLAQVAWNKVAAMVLEKVLVRLQEVNEHTDCGSCEMAVKDMAYVRIETHPWPPPPVGEVLE